MLITNIFWLLNYSFNNKDYFNALNICNTWVLQLGYFLKMVHILRMKSWIKNGRGVSGCCIDILPRPKLELQQKNIPSSEMLVQPGMPSHRSQDHAACVLREETRVPSCLGYWDAQWMACQRALSPQKELHTTGIVHTPPLTLRIWNEQLRDQKHGIRGYNSE